MWKLEVEHICIVPIHLPNDESINMGLIKTSDNACKMSDVTYTNPIITAFA